ncbi:MAG: hydroxyacid dehydrogenase [Actinomycetota bacterium]|nr:hydroxyacid dehydrogenase [Actinomycetota bacterium]
MGRRVHLEQPIHEEALALLRENAEVSVGFGPEARKLDDVLLAEINALLVRTKPLGAEEIEKASRLRVIARHGVGVDNIAVEAATRRGIPVLITPRANLRSVAEHVFTLALAVSRNLLRADRYVREGRFAERDSLVGRELFGERLGVIGMGRIGEEVARMGAAGFGMRVLGYDPFVDEKALRAQGVEPVSSLDELLPACDFVSVHVPLTEETRGLLGARELGLMRPGSVLVQAARGGIVDEGALVEALRDGPLAGAGIDVFGEEPPPADHPLFSVENAVLSPHTAASTRQAMRRMGLDAACGILDILDGADALSPPIGAAWQTVNPSFAVAGE